VIDWITALDFSRSVASISTRLKEMAASLYIVVEGEDPGFDTFVEGCALARNEDALERLAERLNVPALLNFFSADEDSMALLMEQGSEDREWRQPLPQPQWFDASDGLLAVSALIGFLASTPAGLGSETQPVLIELRQYQRVLRKAALRGLHWHIAVSWR
jgi:hypothetical protein